MKVLRDAPRSSVPWRGRLGTLTPGQDPERDRRSGTHDRTAPSPRGAKRAHRIGVPLMHSLWHVTQHNTANMPMHATSITVALTVSMIIPFSSFGVQKEIAKKT